LNEWRDTPGESVPHVWSRPEHAGAIVEDGGRAAWSVQVSSVTAILERHPNHRVPRHTDSRRGASQTIRTVTMPNTQLLDPQDLAIPQHPAPDAEGLKTTIDGVLRDVLRSCGAGKSRDAAVTIEPQMELTKDLGLDSLDVLELVSALENQFDIEMSDDVFEAVSTVGDLHRYMVATLAKPAA